MAKRVLVSACLLGTACRYDGKSVPNETLTELIGAYELIPVCPEISGGLPTPRPPAERQGSRVVTKTGEDVTAQYECGAAETLRLCRLFDCRLAVLKEKSPSCGCRMIYDGSFTGTLTRGVGVTAELLIKNGVKVIGESEAGLLKVSED